MLIEFSSAWKSQAVSCAIGKIADNSLPFSECADRNAMTSTAQARHRIPVFRAPQGDDQIRTRTKPAAGGPGRAQSKISRHRKRVPWVVADSSRHNQDCRTRVLPGWLVRCLRVRARSNGRSIRRRGAARGMQPTAVFQFARRHKKWASHSLKLQLRDEGIVLSKEINR